jgi:hypothetical protein
MMATETAATGQRVSAKQQRLAKSANKLVPKALEALSKVAALGRLNPTPEQANKIIAALNEGLDAVVNAFLSEPKSNFTL